MERASPPPFARAPRAPAPRPRRAFIAVAVALVAAAIALLTLRSSGAAPREDMALPELRAEPRRPWRVVHVESTPPGATVYDGEERLGVTPLDVRMDPGRGPARLRVTLDGHAPHHMVQEPPADDLTMMVLLAPLAATREEAPSPAGPSGRPPIRLGR